MPESPDLATLYENIGITKPCWIRYSDIQKMLESGLDTGIVVKNYGDTSKVFRSRADYEQQKQADQDWHRLRGFANCRRPDHMTPEKIAQILEILQKP